jgi:hypothetical protein
MAIDTVAKRRNVARMLTFPLLMSLASANGLSDDDRENASSVYIGFDYAEAPPAAVVVAVRSGIRQGMGIGF